MSAPTRTARPAGKATREENPAVALLIFAGVFWLAGAWWLAALIALFALAGTTIGSIASEAWYRVKLTTWVALIAAAVAAGGAVWLARTAGPVALGLALATGAGVATAALVAVRRLLGYLDREGVWADTAVGWLLWNFVSGAPIAIGQTIADQTDRREIVAARAKVAAPRLLVLGCVGGIAYRFAGAPLTGGALWQLFAVGLGVPLGAGVLGWQVVKGLVERSHWRRWVYPLHLALHEVLGYEIDHPTRRYIKVPRGKAAEGDGVIVGVRPTFRYEDKPRQLVEQLTIRTLGLEDVTATWVGRGRHGYLQLRPTLHAPELVLFRTPSVLEVVERSKASAPLIGLTIGDKPVAFDLDSEAPHLLLSAGTGGGKSETLKSLVAQLMHHGGVTVVIDLKRHSQQWLRGLPGVVYVRDAEDIHELLLWLATEGDRRNRAFDHIPTGQPGPKFPRMTVVAEELNATFSKLRRYWSTIRPTGAPQLSPAVEGFQDLMFMGRAVGITVLAVAQMASAKDLGGPEARENFVVRLLARYSMSAWKMLAPDAPYVPAPTEPGRAMVYRAGVATETQRLYMSDSEAIDWGTGGITPPELDLRDLLGSGTPVDQGEDLARLAASGPLALPAAGSSPTDGVTLKEAVELGVVPMSHHALRGARDTNPEFPKPVSTRTVRGGTADVFDPEHLRWWHRNRPGTKGVKP